MKLKPKTKLVEHFSELEDPRIERTKRHKLIDIVTITLLGVICGAESWVAIESFGQAKLKWLKRILELPNGIPSHDTIARLFARLNPEQLQQCFMEWVRALVRLSHGEVIAIDGKTLRQSYNRSDGKGAIHRVSAWATQNRLVLGQRKVDEKSNEITAIPQLLRPLEVNGCIVTIDAMGTQTAIAQLIVEREGDYVLALKDNQGNLFEDVQQIFAHETRYYISSLTSDARRLAQAVRSHWQVEPSLHWVLDLAFLEDTCRIRKDHAPQNLAVVRHIALNLLTQETTAKLGIKNKRLRAGWDEDYLLKVLLG